MKKKVLDIISPKKLEKILKEKEVKLEIPSPPIKLPPARVLPKIKFKRKGSLFVILLILIFATAFSFKLSKAEIKIWPQTDDINYETKLTVDRTFENSDFGNKIVPGKIFETEKTFSEEFSSSGKVLKKAEGIIRLYNAYTTQPELWQVETRFMSSEGKLFKSKDKISVPGAEIKNGKILPTFVDVPVIAAEAGADYNIGPSHFSIVAYRGTPRYTKFYGESSQPMTGGGEVPQVKKEDLENGEKILSEKAKREIKEVLKSKIPPEYIVLDDVLETKILEKFSLAEAGKEMEKFNFQVKVKGTAISFKNEDLKSFAKEFILSQVGKGKLIYLESLKMDYSPQNPNFESGKFQLSLTFAAKIYPEIDISALKKGIAGKTSTEAKIVMENYLQINRVDIRLSPFWLKNIPEDINKIEIKYPLID